MRDLMAFLNVKRQKSLYRPANERARDYRDVAILRSDEDSQEQASRCMRCGVPFCHWRCPLGNYVFDWNEFMSTGHWIEAYYALEATNNLPEITGRLCPSLCEYACVVGINEDPVTIRENELAVIEYAFRAGFVEPRPPTRRTGKSVAVVGSGPAGLSCAAQLNRAGHHVVVFERDDKIGGILRYGIPDFKLEKWIIDRRLDIWKEEGIEYATGTAVGADYPVSKLLKEFDAVCLTGGSRMPRDLKIEGRDLKGIHFAMEYLVQSNRRVAGEHIPTETLIDAKGKKVVVIGGGDTGADCVGTAHRQGASRVVQIELFPKPPELKRIGEFWPDYPNALRTSTSHEEGGVREWSILTKKFTGENGCVKKLSCVRAEYIPPSDHRGPSFKEIPETGFELEGDLVILAMGFVSPDPHGFLDKIGVALDPKGNVQTNSEYLTSVQGVFSAGDMRRGQSLVAIAVSEGRRAAHYIDRHLMGRTYLPLMM